MISQSSSFQGEVIISCPVEYLHFGGRKAAMLKALMLKEKKGLKEEGFLSRYYPDMILFIIHY
ncbi:MAG: hypothetical protein F6K39_34360 [Okeania sp. SIO3B3]|nr:hypothetical protein [Okeania sp. SIO3B3]